MNAPADIQSLVERILAVLAKAKATSRRPARAADIAALIGGPEAAFWAALEQMVGAGLVATAHIQRMKRDAEPWLAIWPTGVVLTPARLSGASLSHLFTPQRPLHEALRDASTPRTRLSA